MPQHWLHHNSWQADTTSHHKAEWSHHISTSSYKFRMHPGRFSGSALWNATGGSRQPQIFGSKAFVIEGRNCFFAKQAPSSSLRCWGAGFVGTSGPPARRTSLTSQSCIVPCPDAKYCWYCLKQKILEQFEVLAFVWDLKRVCVPVGPESSFTASHAVALRQVRRLSRVLAKCSAQFEVIGVARCLTTSGYCN